jgi:Protein of unknown function (DUF732)
MKTEAIETQLGLPALQNLAYSQTELETVAEHEVSTPWRDAYVRAARIGLLGAFAAMAIVATSYAVPQHQWTTATTNPISGVSNSAEPPQDVKPLVMPPDAGKLSQDDRYLKVLQANWAPFGLPISDPKAAISVGHQECAYLSRGVTAQKIADSKALFYDNGGIVPPDIAMAQINAAEEVFCPNVG